MGNPVKGLPGRERIHDDIAVHAVIHAVPLTMRAGSTMARASSRTVVADIVSISSTSVNAFLPAFLVVMLRRFRSIIACYSYVRAIRVIADITVAGPADCHL